MKKIYNYLLLMVLIGCVNETYAVQLSGNYTINPSLAASATNFQNFASAITYLTSASTRTDGGPVNATPFGVNGAVTFNVSAATFTGQFTVPAITGASATNTITFKGASRTSTIVTFAATSNTARHTILLNLCTYVTFRDMTVRGTGGTYGWVFHLTGTNTNFNKIKNCQIELTGTGANSTSTNFAGIVISGSTTSATTGIRIDGTEIDSNTISNTGYYGIAAAGLSGNLQLNTKIRNNQILGSGVYGCYLNYQNGVTVSNNFLNLRTSYLYNYGIYLLNSTSTAGNRALINNNRIINFGYQGLQVSSSNNPVGNKGLIYNNVIGGLVKYDYGSPLYFSSSSQWTVVNNSVNHDLAGYNNSYSAAFFSGGSGNAVYNNIFSESKPGQGLSLYASASSVFDTLNYNVYYRADTSNGVIAYIGSNISPTSLIGANSQNLNSIVANPQFVNDTNLVIDNACFSGIPVPAIVTTDYNGNLRSVTSPTIGAYEVTPVANNLHLVKISSPVPPLTSGYTDLNLFVRNNGNNTVTSFNYTYQHNSGTPITSTWSGSLAPCDTVTVNFTGANQINIGNTNSILTYIDGPNSSLDPNRKNDTIRAEYYLPLSGLYTIGGTTPDFPNLTSAVAALYTGGITGPVTFSVRPGVYVGQLTFDNPILGVSSSNNIVFEGVNKSTTIVEFNTTSNSARHVIRIGQSNITFRNFTIRSNSNDYAWGVHISKNNTSNVKIKNCDITLTSSNAIAGTSDYFGGIVMSGSNTSIQYYDVFVLDSIEIDSNNITNGYFGIFQYSYFYSYYYTYGAQSERIFIRNNNIRNTYYYGIFAAGLKGLVINNNVVSMMKASGTSPYAIYVQNVSLPSANYEYSIYGNKLYNSGYIGLYQYNITCIPAKRGRIINNLIAGGFSYAGSYGVNAYNLTNIDIFHNSILVDDVSTSNTSGAFYLSSGSNNKIRNNHFVVSNPSSLATPCYLSSGAVVSNNTELNYNNYYKPDTNTSNYIYVGGWLTYGNFRGSSSYNTNSIGINPNFVNDTNLVTNNGCLNGDTISSVTVDISNNTRSLIPDIGAYEVPSLTDNAAVEGINSPIFPITSGLQDITIKFRNGGSNTISSLNVGYIHNGGTPKIATWFGTGLASCDTASLTLTGAEQINIVQGVTNTIKIFTSNPNATTDSDPLNDTLTIQLGTPLRGNYLIGSAPSDFINLNTAVNNLRIRGIDSAVNFRIKTGTYNEQITISPIMGSSETNLVTFTSVANHVDSVTIVRNNTTSSNNFIITMNGAKNVIFNRITFTTQNSTNSKIFELAPNSGYLTIQNCKLNAPTTTTTAASAYIINSNNNTVGNINIVNNRITGGSISMYLRGTSTTNLLNNINIDSNTIINPYYMGIYFYYNANQRIRNNTLTTTSAYTSFYAIYAYYVDSTFEIINNNISTTTANGYGINTYYCDGFGSKTGYFVNNVIRIGSNTTTASYGIRDQYSSNMKIFHNTIGVLSTSTTSYAGYFYYSGSISSNNVIRNNVFANLGAGYSVYFYNPLYGNSNYNNLFTNGTTLAQRGTPAATYTTLALARTGFGNNYETNSIQFRPGFTSNNNLAPNLSDTAVWSLQGRAEFVGVSNDINNQLRSTLVTNGPTDIGAYEFTPTSLPPLCVASPSVPVAGGYQIFMLAGDTVLTVLHDAFSTPPSFLNVRQYTGVKPPNTNFTANYMKMYVKADAPSGFYNGNVKLFYKKEWLGTVPTELDLRFAQKDSVLPWFSYISTGSTVDTLANTISVNMINSYNVFTGTDDFNSLPVKLTNFNGIARNNSAVLNWATASEVNSSNFDLERSFDSRTFTKISTIRAKGNSNSLVNYSSIDENVFATNKTVYYRLKMIDLNGEFEYSRVVKLNANMSRNEITVGPNPFKNNVVVNNINSSDIIELFDLNGKSIYKTEVLADGSLEIILPENIKTGIYFLKVKNTIEEKVFKLIKN